jgi:hypothetical protein
MDATTTLTLRCTACGVLADAKCNCGVAYAYISPGELAQRAVNTYPKWSSRALANKLGIDPETVRRARATRKTTAANAAVAEKRIGLDGKERQMPRKRGRPPKPTQQKAAELFLDEGLTRGKVSEQTGLREFAIRQAVERELGRREAATDPEIDRAMLSMSAQQKLDAAVRQATRKVERTFEVKVQTEVKSRMAVANASTQEAKNKAAERERMYREFLDKQKKLGTLSEWNNLVLCLHPDTRRTASDEKYDAAFRWVLTKKFAITGER